MDLALFDLDKTLISDDSASLWLHWLVSQGYTSTDSLQFHLEQMHPITDYTDSPPDPATVTSYLANALAPMSGYHCSTVSGWVERFVHRDILPRLYPQARQQIAWHRERGDCMALVSASGDHLVSVVARRLGIEHIFALQAEVQDAPLCFTGKTLGDLTFHQGSVRRIQAWFEQPSTPAFKHIYAYSDSIYDLPLLEFADKPTVVNGCRELRKTAQAKGWPYVNWSRHPASATATSTPA